ncbi:hypothetical protein L7F22_015060 [Adiantum nelumboides]|nr:hypothetical protein [Adiantum nelumboides]
MKGEGFSVPFYPLYGSSLVVTNFILGTIVGRAHLLLVPQRGTHQCLVIESIGKWQHFRKTIEIGEGKLFSPSNLFVTFDNPKYGKLIKYYVGKKYTLRYTGGSGGSLIKILVYHSAREGNIHKCVVSKYKGKAALLFEVAPMGLLIEKASGYSGDGNQSVLDKIIVGTNDRTQVAYGSKNESFALRRLSLVCLASRPWSEEKWVMATSSGKKNDMPLLRPLLLPPPMPSSSRTIPESRPLHMAMMATKAILPCPTAYPPAAASPDAPDNGPDTALPCALGLPFPLAAANTEASRPARGGAGCCMGKKNHDAIDGEGFLKEDIVLGTALTDIYVKYRVRQKSQKFLEELCFQNAVFWNALAIGYAQQGQGQEAMCCFHRMQIEGLSPDVITYIAC